MPSAICARLCRSRLSRINCLTHPFSAGIAEVKGRFAKSSLSGPVEQAAKPLHGWLGLCEKLIHSQDQSVRYTAENETFLFRF
jgi:hypothetical protein